MHDQKLLMGTRNHFEQEQEFGLGKSSIINIVKGRIKQNGYKFKDGKHNEALSNGDYFEYFGN